VHFVQYTPHTHTHTLKQRGCQRIRRLGYKPDGGYQAIYNNNSLNTTISLQDTHWKLNKEHCSLAPSPIPTVV